MRTTNFKHLAISCLLMSTAMASETDQFVTWKADLNDAAPAFNKLLDHKLRDVLAKPNKKPKGFSIEACRKITQSFMKELDASPSLKRITKEEYQKDHPGKYPVDIYPRKHVDIKEYYRDSIHSGQTATKLKEIGKSVRVGGVNFGNDKMTHFVGVGASYYDKYLDSRKAGYSHERALKYAMWRGFQKEATILGLKWGTFSFGDLEANYQGWRLAYNLCEGKNPHVKYQGGKWEIVKPINISEYFTPAFDESYYRNYYRPFKLKIVSKVIHEHDYCSRIHSPKMQSEFASHDRRQSKQRVALDYAEKLLDINIKAEATYPGMEVDKSYFPLTVKAQTFEKICSNQIDYDDVKPAQANLPGADTTIYGCPTKQAGFKIRGRILSKTRRDVSAAITNWIQYAEDYCYKRGKSDFEPASSYSWVSQSQAPSSVPFASYYIKTCLKAKVKCK